jgi:hypothetical protein
MSFECEYCFNVYNLKYHLSRHQNSDSCKKIQNIIIDFNDKINKINEKLKENDNEYNNKIEILTQENIHLKNEIKNYKNIIENISVKNIVFKKDTDKIKNKEVSEELVKKEIQCLKLTDNHQLEYRKEDGFINVTNLFKAGNKYFKIWNKNNKTKEFLDTLSSTTKIISDNLIKNSSGDKLENSINEIWVHPQVAINIAQWISPEFDNLVTMWIHDDIMTYKNIDNKTNQLDTIDEECKFLKNRIKMLENKVLKKQPREKIKENKNTVYIVTTEHKEENGHYKIGKSQNLQNRMSVYNTTDKHKVVYSTSCKTKEKMDILEKLVHDKLESIRIEPNKEWFESKDKANDIIKIIEELKKVVD